MQAALHATLEDRTLYNCYAPPCHTFISVCQGCTFPSAPSTTRASIFGAMCLQVYLVMPKTKTRLHVKELKC